MNNNMSSLNTIQDDNGRRLDDALRRTGLHGLPGYQGATAAQLQGLPSSAEYIRLQVRNKELEKQVEALKENTIIESMNDMKESYKTLIKENVELREQVTKHEESNIKKELESMKKKANIYAKIIKRLESKGRAILCVSEAMERAIRDMSDSDGDICIPEIMLDGIFSVMQASNESMENYIGHEITHDLDCAKDKCGGCYRCCCNTDVDVLEVC